MDSDIVPVSQGCQPTLLLVIRAGGGGWGLFPSKPPGRVPRPPTLVAPFRGATRGAGEGTATLASGTNILLADTNGCVTEPPTVEALSSTPILELGNARQFFVLRLMVSK